MKLAFFSPFNPQPSGISDYSEELLPYLARHAEIDLFVDGFVPSNRELISNFRWFDYQKDPANLKRFGDYDAVIYHMGNDHRYHTGIARVMTSHPGIVVFHDFALQDFFLALARERNKVSIYLDELEACNGKRERERAEGYLARGNDPPQAAAPLEFPMNCRLARSAEGIIVHSKWSRDRLSRITAVPIAHINHHITARAAAEPLNDKLKRDSGGRVELASFGLITPEKGIERTLRALKALSDRHDFHYALVGSANNFPEIRDMIKQLGLHDRVTITGHVALEEFERLIANTDVAINLRERAVGATSGSLCRIMAAGVPAIISNVGAFSELPDDAVVKIDHDEHADALLRAYLQALIEDEPLRQQIGRNARRYVLAEHEIEASAAKYVDFVRNVIARRPRRHFVSNVARELTALGVTANEEKLLTGLAAEVALLLPTDAIAGAEVVPRADRTPSTFATTMVSTQTPGNGHRTRSNQPAKVSGRLPKLDGVDYKQAALEYPRVLDAERSHYLRTKPFYNLANKPEKHHGDGMDAETHRHFTDFANMASVLALPAGATILDVGCGSGWLSEYFARLGYVVTGIDISDELISMARERVERVAYQVDHETPLRCSFQTLDIEAAALKETFDAVICYDSLHHFEDERKVFRHLAAMLNVGGSLFILEGHKPSAGSATEAELQDVMRRYGTLESPFSGDYLRALLDEYGFAIVGDYVSVNGLFERELLETNGSDLRLPLSTLPTDYHYLTCMKVVAEGPASSVPDSRAPRLLSAQFTLLDSSSKTLARGAILDLSVRIRNTGDTLWLHRQTVRAGVVMPGIKIRDQRGATVTELHGHPLLPRSVPPGGSIDLDIHLNAPADIGDYTLKIDLVDQHICWFEERGSQPLIFSFEVRD
jgi:glycosyltransferase involved in cell wall biosynthesis/SAM-dependent methyltransferase